MFTATLQAAYKGRLRVRPAAQRVYINALWRARVCEKSSSSCVYTKCDIIIIRYRARPGCVLLVLHTAKRVVTTGAERSRAPVAAARHPSLHAGRHIPTRRTHTRVLTTHQRTLQRGAGARAYSRVVLVYNDVYRCYIMVTCLLKLPISHHTIIPVRRYSYQLSSPRDVHDLANTLNDHNFQIK